MEGWTRQWIEGWEWGWWAGVQTGSMYGQMGAGWLGGQQMARMAEQRVRDGCTEMRACRRWG